MDHVNHWVPFPVLTIHSGYQMANLVSSIACHQSWHWGLHDFCHRHSQKLRDALYHAVTVLVRKIRDVGTALETMVPILFILFQFFPFKHFFFSLDISVRVILNISSRGLHFHFWNSRRNVLSSNLDSLNSFLLTASLWVTFVFLKKTKGERQWFAQRDESSGKYSDILHWGAVDTSSPVHKATLAH